MNILRAVHDCPFFNKGYDKEQLVVYKGGAAIGALSKNTEVFRSRTHGNLCVTKEEWRLTTSGCSGLTDSIPLVTGSALG